MRFLPENGLRCCRGDGNAGRASLGAAVALIGYKYLKSINFQDNAINVSIDLVKILRG